LSTPEASDELSRLAAEAVAALKSRGLTIATAEATTGGLIGHLLTSVPGSSAVFRGGIAPYSNSMKLAIGVSAKVLDLLGAVSEGAAEELASAVRRWADADIGLAETGMAGPTGREPGLFWIALCVGQGARPGIRSRQFRFDGDRVANQRSCAEAALRMLLQPPS
jgi:PncC family amidohydrolase